jgi:probable rRNA maturation factor
MADAPPNGSHLRVSVVDADGRPLPARTLASWLAQVAPRRARGEVTVAVVSDTRVRRLNREYRGVDRPTDVLSFPADIPPYVGQPFRAAVRRAQAPTHGPHVRRGHGHRDHHLGDSVIARGVADRQARRARHSTATEWRILALHGLLHLLGYDHDGDQGRMARIERRLRRKGGLPAGLIERSVTE